jgi:hypothetical protein
MNTYKYISFQLTFPKMNNAISGWRFRGIFVGFLVFLASVSPALAAEALLLQDTYVDNGTPFQTFINYGNSGDLRVFKSGSRSMRSLLKFSLDTLPPGTISANVVQARLRLWVNSNTLILGAITMTPITSTWDEVVIRNITSGGMIFGSPKITNLPVNSSSDFVSIDVTDWVKAWISGALINEGFQVEANPGVNSLDLSFDSKESNQTSHEPRLEIVLASIGPQGPVGPTGPSGATGLAGPAGPAGPTGLAGPQGPAGATGAQGPVGPTGPAGPTGLMGRPGLSWKGEWSDSASYVSNDVVFFGGSAFAALQANTNVPPPALGTWNLLARKGDDGAVGPQGPMGLAGAPGIVGAPGDRGLQGPEGPVGSQGPPGPIGPQGPTAVWPTRILPQGDLSMGEFTQGSPP